MMESADFRHRNNRPYVRRLDRARDRRVLLQSQVRPAPMIIVHEALQVTGQALFAEHDYVVQALAADGADDAFDTGSLQGERGADSACFIPMESIWSTKGFPKVRLQSRSK